MKDQRIYISGKIAGLDWPQCKALFRVAYNELAAYCKVAPNNIISPIGMGETYGMQLGYDDIMHLDLALLDRCDAIYMLENHTDSPGAQKELAHAQALGLDIYYQTDVRKSRRNNNHDEERA